MPQRPKQLELAIREKFTHGGRRKGAGRPKTSRLQSHVSRAEFQSRHPLHVTIRLAGGLPDLRRRELYRAFRAAVFKARESGLRIAHFSILSNHFHLIVESEEARSLARGMQSMGVSLAKRVNAKLKRKGAVLNERYHLHILKTPREVKHALDYVLANDYRHQGRKGWIARNWYSSAVTLANETWKALLGRDWASSLDPRDVKPEREVIERSVRELITEPRTWLLREGWLRAKAA